MYLPVFLRVFMSRFGRNFNPIRDGGQHCRFRCWLSRVVIKMRLLVWRFVISSHVCNNVMLTLPSPCTAPFLALSVTYPRRTAGRQKLSQTT